MKTGGTHNEIRKLESAIQDLPKTIAFDVAADCAEIITSLARQTFARSENGYGDPWAPSDAGETVDLVQSGDLKRDIEYRAIGTKLRARLGPRYAKYQVGKRPVFPTGKLPIAYREALTKRTREILNARLRGLG